MKLVFTIPPVDNARYAGLALRVGTCALIITYTMVQVRFAAKVLLHTLRQFGIVSNDLKRKGIFYLSRKACLQLAKFHGVIFLG
jgi:hypothetical protein